MANRRERRGLQRFRLAGVRSIGREIGRGSYAAVVELEFHGLKCAGKKLYSHIYNDVGPLEQQGMLQRFETECEIMNKLKHPKIVQFMGVHFEAGSELPTLVMEFLHTTLSACLNRYGRLPVEISYNILEDVATALCFLHGQNPPVIHRDLTANNVLLTSDMRAKVSDLGVAKILNFTPAQRTQMTTCPGTPAYMPPEAIAHDPTYDRSIDTFSYGVLMLHVASARWPIPGEANRVDPDNPSRLIPLSEAERREAYFRDVDPNHPLRRLITRCLSNYPPSRPNAEEILRQMREVLGQQPPAFEDKVALLNQHREETQALQEEVSGLQEEVRNLLGQSQTLEEAAHRLSEENSGLQEQVRTLEEGELVQLRGEVQRHELREESLQNHLLTMTVENEGLRSLLEAKKQETTAKDLEVAAKSHEIVAKDQEIMAKDQLITAQDQVISAKDQEIAVKVSEVSAIREESASKNATLRAKDGVIQRLLQQSDRIMEQLASTPQEHVCILKPGVHLRWKREADMPVGMTAPQCIMIDSTIYVGGGETGHEHTRYTLCIYQSEKDEWSTTECPIKFFGLGCLDDRPVIVGGQNQSNQMTAKAFTFDEHSQRWNNSLPPMPTARSRPCIISSAFGIAVCGGTTRTGCVTVVEVFKTATQHWHSTFPLPQPRMVIRATTLRNSCYLLGGYYLTPPSSPMGRGDCFYSDLNALFDTTSTTTQSCWLSLPQVPVGAAPANLFGVVAAVGGTSSRQILAFSPCSHQWVHVADCPEMITVASCITQRTEVFIVGGWHRGEVSVRSNNVWKGTLITDSN